MTVVAASQRTLFGDSVPVAGPTKFKVAVFAQRRAWSSAFAMVVAEARGVAVAGHRAVILGSDGTAAEVRTAPPRFLTRTCQGFLAHQSGMS